MVSTGDSTLWLIFSSLVVVIFSIDFFLIGGRKHHLMRPKEAWMWVGTWASCALGFGAVIWYHILPIVGPMLAKQKVFEYLTAYLIEESLSVDNMFVILVIFQSFAVPLYAQRRVLLWGVMGAIIMRIIMILAGTWLVSRFSWLLYVFGALLVWTGSKIFFIKEQPKNPADSFFVQWATRFMRVTKEFVDENFFVKKKGLWFATPLLLALVLVEITDLIFALDSIPAVFSVTLDKFIVITSNIFAVLGLRALYFVVADLADRFELLKYGIALILVFIGGKMLIHHWVVLPIVPMLSVVVGILFVTILAAWLLEKKRVTWKK